ncbi:MAG: hypothetical protein ACM3XP_04155, partial [Nitrososphaerales archaeon]
MPGSSVSSGGGSGTGSTGSGNNNNNNNNNSTSGPGAGISDHNASLKVLEAYTRDVGRGIARIDYDTMDSLAVSTGDVVEIRGKR